MRNVSFISPLSLHLITAGWRIDKSGRWREGLGLEIDGVVFLRGWPKDKQCLKTLTAHRFAGALFSASLFICVREGARLPLCIERHPVSHPSPNTRTTHAHDTRTRTHTHTQTHTHTHTCNAKTYTGGKERLPPLHDAKSQRQDGDSESNTKKKAF